MKEILIIGNQVNGVDNDSIDKNLIRALAEFYGHAISDDTTDFENCLVHYFKDNYNEIIQNGNVKFLSENICKIAKQFDVDTSLFDNQFGCNLVIKDGLIYENGANGLNVIYGTDKALNDVVSDLYGVSLYHSHLAKEHASQADLANNLKDAFSEYVDKKNNVDNSDNVIDFKEANSNY